MAHQLREVGLDFIETAPVRMVFVQEMSAPPEAVYQALAEDVPGWEEWFAAVTLARSTGDGSTREIHLKGGGRFQETVIAAKGPEVYAYRVDVANAPGARAIAEEWRLTPSGAGTQVRWFSVSAPIAMGENSCDARASARVGIFPASAVKRIR